MVLFQRFHTGLDMVTYARSIYQKSEYVVEGDAEIFGLAGTIGSWAICGATTPGGLFCTLAFWGGSGNLFDQFNVEKGDYHIDVGPFRFNFNGQGMEDPSWRFDK